MLNKKPADTPEKANTVIEFWRNAGPEAWFEKNTAFDDDFRHRFLALHFAAARREHEDWSSSPYAGLALILLLDQFPRNAFRGTAHMYATDPLARHYARVLIESGFIDYLDAELKSFACLPFMHSENIDDQVYALDLYRKHAPADNRWAIEHHDIIQRFGRFPHRNAELARINTPEEQRFLDEGGFAG